MFTHSSSSLLALLFLLLNINIAQAASLSSRSRSHHAHALAAARHAEPEPFNPFHSPEWKSSQSQPEFRAEGEEEVLVERAVNLTGQKKNKKRDRKIKRTACYKPTTTSQAPSSTVVVVPTTSSTSVSSTLIVQNAPVLTSTSVKPSSTSTSTKPAATTASGFKSPDYEGNGPFNGETTYYVLGTDGSAIGACGTNLVDSDKIAAASEYLFDSWPGATGNPNTNPICGQYAKVHYQGKSVVVQIQDRCPGCEKRHLDLSPSAFSQLASFDVGMMDVTWEWVSGPNA